jgi:hypothetical protein
VVVTRALTSRPIPRLALALLLAVLAASSCGGDDNSSSATTTSSAPTTTVRDATSSTPAPTNTDEVAVRTAYEAASQAFIEAAAIPDPDYAALTATHTGPMLEQRRDTLLGLQADGRVIRYPSPSQYRVEVENIHVEGDVARLAFCAVDDGERVVESTGEVVASGVATVRGQAAMRLEGGAWKLAEQEFDSRESGAATC